MPLCSSWSWTHKNNKPKIFNHKNKSIKTHNIPKFEHKFFHKNQLYIQPKLTFKPNTHNFKQTTSSISQQPSKPYHQIHKNHKLKTSKSTKIMHTCVLDKYKTQPFWVLVLFTLGSLLALKLSHFPQLGLRKFSQTTQKSHKALRLMGTHNWTH